MENQMLFENLDEKFEDEASVITAKWLSVNFNQTIDESERLLAAYLDVHKGLSAVYLLTGLDENDQVIVQLVPQEKLLRAEKRFAKAPIKVVYSLQRQACRSSSTLTSIDLLLDLNQEKLKNLTTIPWNPTAVAPRIPLADSQKNQINISSEIFKPSVPIAKATLPEIASSGTDPHIKTTQVKNFFAPVDKPANKITAASKPVLKRPSHFFEAPKKNTPVKTPNASDDEEEFLTSAVINSSKRKRLIVESDEDEEDTPGDNTTTTVSISSSKAHSPKQSVKTAILNTEQVDNIPTKPGRRKKNTKDVLVEDSETDSPQTSKSSSRGRKSRAEKEAEQSVAKSKTQEKHEAVSPPEPKSIAVKSSPIKTLPALPRLSSSKRNRVRRQVMKTYKDEDGFMVTEKVWESGSEEEVQEEEHNDCQTTYQPNASPTNEKTNTQNPVSQSSTSLGNARLTGTPTLGTSKSTPQPPKISKASARKPAPKQASLSAFFSRA